MPTPLTKPVVRAIGTCIVKLTAEGVLVREPGKRTWYGPVAYGRIKLQAAHQMANAAREMKAARRRTRRGLL